MKRLEGKETKLAKRAEPLIAVMDQEGIRELRINRSGKNCSIELKSVNCTRPSAEEVLRWLETKTVNVRTPLVHGSRDIFWAPSEDNDGAEEPSTLYKQCMEQMAAEAKEVK